MKPLLPRRPRLPWPLPNSPAAETRSESARDYLCPAPRYPANALVVVQGLAEPHVPVEIEAIAVLE